MKITSSNTECKAAATSVRWFFLALFVAFGLIAGSEANAQSVGRLMFLNSVNGTYLFGGINPSGKFVTVAAGTGTGWIGKSKLVATGQGILAYNPVNGKANIAWIFDGAASDTSDFLFSAAWQQIVSMGNYVFFYNGSSTGAVVTFDYLGNRTQTATLTTLSTGWTKIAPTDNYLLFYNSTNGLVAVGTIDQGNFSTTASATVLAGYTDIVSLGDNVLLYNLNNGKYETGSISFTGTYSNPYSVVAHGKLPAGFTSLIQQNGHVLLYNSFTGTTVIGYFLASGGFVQTQKSTLEAGWTNVVAAGRFLIFYNFTTGTLAVGYISAAGKFVQTDALPIGTNLFYIAATQR